jgi:hypothetical protein
VRENRRGDQEKLKKEQTETLLCPARLEYFTVDHWEGKGGDWGGLPDEFDDWAISTKNNRSKLEWSSVTVHTHPYYNFKGEIETTQFDPSPGDFKNAPRNNVDAILTKTTIVLFDGNGTHKKKNFIRCHIDRATGKSFKIE